MSPIDTTTPPRHPSARHRGHHHTDNAHLRHWSPTLLAARIALLALSLGGAFWSTRWAWQQVTGR